MNNPATALAPVFTKSLRVGTADPYYRRGRRGLLNLEFRIWHSEFRHLATEFQIANSKFRIARFTIKSSVVEMIRTPPYGSDARYADIATMSSSVIFATGFFINCASTPFRLPSLNKYNWRAM